MQTHRNALTWLAAGLLLLSTPVTAQEVAKRATKRAAREATESAARQAAEDAAKKAIKKAAAPDAIDLNAATPEQLGKLGLDEATTQKVVAARPFSGMDDPKIKEAIPADALAKLQGKVTVKAPAADKPAHTAKPATETATPPSN